MEFIKLYGKEIFSLFVPLFTLILNHISRSRVKLSYGTIHEFTYLIKEPILDENKNIIKDTQLAHTQAMVFQNSGKEPANKLEVVFNYRPMYLNLWPVRHFEEHVEVDGRYIIVFDNLAPKDGLRMEVLSINQALPELLSVRSKENVAKLVSFYPQVVVNTLLRNFLIFLMMIGLATFVYFTILLLQWLIVRTG